MKRECHCLLVAATAVASFTQELAAQPLVKIETVLVDNAGSAWIGYDFMIGKYEVTIGQYTTFLNSVAARPTNAGIASLYHIGMEFNEYIGGSIKRDGSGTQSDPYVYSAIGSSNLPVPFIGYFQAARFANWVNNGATNGASTETGAHDLSGEGNPYWRMTNAVWFLPNAEEWVKAAFHKRNAGAHDYWVYPTQSDEVPWATFPPGTNNSANYNWIMPTGFIHTEVGSYTTSPSPYGTFDQGGNVQEWVTESTIIGLPHLRGGHAMMTEESLRYPSRSDSSFEPGWNMGFRLARVVAPALIVEQPTGTAIGNNGPTRQFPDTRACECAGALAPDGPPNPIIYTVKNSGLGELQISSIGKQGSQADEFTISHNVTFPVVLKVNESFQLSVSFQPTSGGTKTLQVAIESNDPYQNPFILNVAGFGIGEGLDSDDDGLNDAAEYCMSPLGFNYKVKQNDLVQNLYLNAALAGLYSSNFIIADPSVFGLYSAGDVSTSRAEGRNDVIADPAAFGLYTSNSIMDLRMGGLMMQRQGSNAVVTFQPQSSTDLATQPFTNHGTPITNTIPMPGNKGFLRIQAKPNPTPVVN